MIMNNITNTSVFDKLILYFTASLSGAIVMVIELLGTRIIGPFYGVSLYVWSALISVTLIALALGYFIGGVLADKKNGFKLSHVISLAALFTAMIPFISSAVLLATDTLGIRGGAFSSAVILFTIPLTLLGMVGPFIITMTADRLNIIGSVSGSVYAISTFGSVLGTLLLVFYLLPKFGSREIISAVSIILIVLSIFWGVYEKKSGNIIWTTIPLSAVTGLILIASYSIDSSAIPKNFVQIFSEESIFGRVRVIEEPKDNIRWLMADASTIGAASLATGKGLLQYQKTIKMLPNYKPDASSALLIGLGSGHLATDFDKLGIITDTIEIDPAVATAAKKHFNFKPKGQLIMGDARYEVRQLKKNYDFIIHDCFTGGTDPSHLLTQEMFQELRKHLKPGGILAVNLVGFLRGEESKGTQAIAYTLKKIFAYTKTLIAGSKNNFNDITFFVSDSPLIINPEKNSARITKWFKKHEYTFSDKNSLLITDNFNPLETLQIKKAELYRKHIIERVGKELMLW